METARQKTVNRAATVQQPAASVKTVQRKAVTTKSSVQLQMSTKVSSPNDPAEKEADSTAKKIMRMAVSESSIAYVKTGNGGVFRQVKQEEKDKKLQTKLQSPYITRFADSGIFTQPKKPDEEKIQRKAEGQPNVASNVAADIQNSMAAGSPLPLSVRRFMEPRFNADFSKVRIHTGEQSARLNRQVNAQAFAMGNQIFFGKDKFKPDSQEGKELIAHELTHTIQQGAAIQRREEVSVTQQSPIQVQRLGISDALDYFADKANLIPGFRMFTIILGVNPINMSTVDRSPANILRALVEFLPGGGLIVQALDNYGIFERIGNWVEQQIRSLGMTGSVIREAINRFLDSLSWRDIFDLGGVWNRAKRIFTEPIDRIISFGRGLVNGIIQFIKDAILRPLARLAEGTRGYDLLKAVLGQDPITGDPVPRNADTLIGGFMKLIGQEEVWNNLKRANAVARAWAWFQGALSGLLGFVRQIPSMFLQALRSLEIADLVLLPRAFARVGSAFASFLGQFFSWAGQQVMSLLQIIFEVVAPGAMPYIRRAAGAFRSIIQNPIGFVGNLVRAGVAGFRQFAGRFVTHLRTSLIGWITGAMSGAGIYIPQAFSLPEIVKFVLSVLNVTWQFVRSKLVRVVGEPAVRAMETGFELVMTLVRDGPAAAWEKIQESLSNLREMVMEQIISFVNSRIVQAAITRLITSLNPAGAFIQAIIATYNTIMFFVERLRQIAQVAMSFIDSISAIAGGVLTTAANRVEQTMAGLLVLVISFLARLVGLGRVSDAVTNIINRIRVPIDRALDRIVDWIVAQARRLGRFIAQAGVPQDPVQRLRLGMQAAVAVVNRFAGRRVGAAVLNPLLAAIRVRYGFRSLTILPNRNRWAVQGQINPGDLEITEALNESAPAGALGFHISGVGSVISILVATAMGGRLAPPPAERFRHAYIGNTPATLAGSPSAIAQRYRTAFPNVGRVVPEESEKRFSLVIGVNAIDDLDNQNRAAVINKVQTGAGVAYPWAIIGFLWRPAWKDSNGAPIADVETVRRALRAPQVTNQDREAARQAERNSIRSDQIPYGAIRTLILQSSQTRTFNTALQARAAAVFVHVSDPDTVSFNPAGDESGTPDALFQRFDRILDGIVTNVQQHAGRGPRANDGGSPIIATGGYEFQFQPDPSQRVTGQTQDLRVRLSARLDMAVRQAMASVDPGSVYFPEPNLLIQITPDTIRASFGTGRLESRRFIESIRRLGLRPRLLFDPSASLATSAERFGIAGTQVMTSWGQLRNLTEADLRAMISGSQSHANQRNWARQVAAAYGLAPVTLAPLNRLWEVFFPVSSLLCGFNPTELRNGVTDRQFTTSSRYGQTSEIRTNLITALTNSRRTPEESAALADRLISLARAGGIGLADALMAIFQRISAG